MHSGGDQGSIVVVGRLTATSHKAIILSQGVQTSLCDSIGCVNAVRSYLLQTIVGLQNIDDQRVFEGTLWICTMFEFESVLYSHFVQSPIFSM